MPSEPSSGTAIKDYTNRYFFSFVVEMQPVQVDTINQSIGIDLGIKPLKNIESSCHRALGDSKRTQRQSKATSAASVSEASRITVASAQ
ncbi:MAG: hypothetical protein VKL00_10270 [Synechococcales bacterium]|nr:hypothetical protein [Synechococcales bacterium]